MLDGVPDYFEIGRFRVMDERRFNARGELVVESEATASILVNGQTHHEAAVGNGPVNAVDTAIRKALSQAYPSLLSDVELIDYKVRILPPDDQASGTGATTRVLIEFADSDGSELAHCRRLSPTSLTPLLLRWLTACAEIAACWRDGLKLCKGGRDERPPDHFRQTITPQSLFWPDPRCMTARRGSGDEKLWTVVVAAGFSA